jgi:2-dehydropantoate 2-reductase
MGVKLPPDISRRQVEKTRPMGPYFSSMQIDRRENRPMEIEAILGAPLRQAIAAGAKMPRLQMIYDLARMIADERIA